MGHNILIACKMKNNAAIYPSIVKRVADNPLNPFTINIQIIRLNN